jgi:hypothetical protein
MTAPAKETIESVPQPETSAPTLQPTQPASTPIPSGPQHASSNSTTTITPQTVNTDVASGVRPAKDTTRDQADNPAS